MAKKKKAPKPPKAEKAPKAKKSKPPRPTKTGKVKKPKSNQPAQNDKFGLTLLILTVLMLIANLLIWDAAGSKVDASMFNKPSITTYDAEILSAPKIIAYESRGVLAKKPGEVDVVVLDKGFRHGVHMGDVFRSGEDWTTSQDVFVEFSVFEVSDSHARAWIIMGTTWSERRKLRLLESSISDRLKPGQTVVTRKWATQDVRKLVQNISTE